MRVTFVEKPQIENNIDPLKKHSDEALKGTVVHQTCNSIYVGSLNNLLILKKKNSFIDLDNPHQFYRNNSEAK